MTRVLTIVASLVAIVVEISVIFRVWIHPVAVHSGFSFYVIPLTTALPLFLCLSMQIGVRKAFEIERVHDGKRGLPASTFVFNFPRLV